MSKASLHVSYDGDAVESGIMDVRDLAPALLSIGELCQQANAVLSGRDTEVSVHVKAEFKKGSFGIDLEVVQSLIAQAKSLLTNENVQSATTIIEAVFGTGGIIALLKWLRGEKDPDTTTLQNGNIKIELKGDNIHDNHIVVKPEIYSLVRDPKVRKAIDGAVRPLKRPGITKLEVKRGGKVIQTVQKDQAPYLTLAPKEEMAVIAEVDEAQGVTRIAYLEIMKLSFKQNNKWGFSDGSGGMLYAEIEDEEFSQKVNRHEYSFGKGDQLKVLLRTRTIKQPGGKYQAEHAILKVLELIPSPQTDMFDSN
jgi:hypothetical protein